MRDTNPATNRELLEALSKFTDHDYSMKELVRTICRSTTYQLSSLPNGKNATDRQSFSRYYPRRLPAEVLLDSIDQMNGSATAFAGLPQGSRAIQIPDHGGVNSYFLTVFGRPERVNTCDCERTQDPSLTQALHAINGETINQKLRAPGGLVDSFLKLGATDETIIRHLYLAALSRRPEKEEINRLLSVMSESKDAAKNTSEARRQAVEDLAWAVLTSKEFLFNH